MSVGDLTETDIKHLRRNIPSARKTPPAETIKRLRLINHKLVTQRNALRAEIVEAKKAAKQAAKAFAAMEKRARSHPAQPPFGPQLPRIVVTQWELPAEAGYIIDRCKEGVHVCSEGYGSDMAIDNIRYRKINAIMKVFDQIAAICKGNTR
jgi:regulator of replication initiation timing